MSTRRLIEVAFQAEFLAREESARHERAQRFIAYFWAYLHTAPDLVNDRKAVDEQFERCKHLIEFDGHGQPKNWWGGSVASLARDLGRMDTYTSDYSWLSQAAHANLAGI